MLCVYFKSGHCEKGNKCKFSHDLDVGRKVEKRNLYEDGREDKANGMYFIALRYGSMLNTGSHRYHGELG